MLKINTWKVYRKNNEIDFIKADDFAVSQEGIISFFMNGICIMIYSQFNWERIKLMKSKEEVE